MLEGLCVVRHSSITARDILRQWLSVHTVDLPVDLEHAQQLQRDFPGYVRTDYLLQVWRELVK